MTKPKDTITANTNKKAPTKQSAPLAALLRPDTLQAFVGQKHLLSQSMPLFEAINEGKLFSVIFWGPPGSGKTTLAHILSKSVNANFIGISAVMAGVKDIRQAVSEAHSIKELEDRPTILFVDEVHRFNKAQQDAFLPFIEDGTFIFVGATTENPSFALNNALLSRAQVVILKPLAPKDLEAILNRAIDSIEQKYHLKMKFTPSSLKALVHYADGDARRILNCLELILNHNNDAEFCEIDETYLESVFSGNMRRFDKGGDIFYEQISALHKSIRGSNPDAALYWFARMIDGGCDPLYIARRVVRAASEDIGNADPRALEIALNAWDTQLRLGSPEGELTLAQAIVYLAVAPKSNAVYTAYNKALEDARRSGSQAVPIHLRNAPTSLMKKEGYGATYRYDHNEEDAFAKGQTYFPEALGEKIYYRPTLRGIEAKIAEKLNLLRSSKKD